MSPKDEKAMAEILSYYTCELLDIMNEAIEDKFVPRAAFYAVLEDMVSRIRSEWVI